MSTKQHRVFERLRIAASLTFISGFLNAFTFITQGGRFAGVQSGNVVYFAYHIAQNNMKQAFNFFIPIFSFVIGQFFTYSARKYFIHHRLPWHFGSSLIISLLITLEILLNPILGPSLTIGILAFAASIQVETFRNIHGLPYANVMMTGNVKNAAYLWFQGVVEKNDAIRKRGTNIFIIIVSFMLGVALATILSGKFAENSLIAVMFPMVYVNFKLWKEKNPR